MNPLCCVGDAPRREKVRERQLTGLDWIEVDNGQRELRVAFVGRAPETLAAEQLRISGGRRERGIKVTDVRFERSGEEDLDDVMVVTVDRPGDYSTYRLEVVDLDERGRPTGRPPSGFDPRYTSLDFSFKAGCPSDQDPAGAGVCPEPETKPAAISYLARDYQSFRQLILDRMALTAPDWTERHAPDLGITIVEILAYAADGLSYYQDAVATEAFIGTARLRKSVRRHARLVDYRMDEGQSAQGWARLTLEGEDELELDPRDLIFTTALQSGTPAMAREHEVKIGDETVFEPEAGTGRIVLRAAHNEMSFYEWGGTECCLPKGAVRATLYDPSEIPEREPAGQGYEGDCKPDEADDGDFERGISEGRWHRLRLRPGDVLIFAETIGPRTGNAADADQGRRHAVRLTRADYGWDPLTGALVVEIAWCPEDALPFPFCLSTRTEAPGCDPIERVSLAFGNIVPVDHGRSVEDELEAVGTAEVQESCAEACEPEEIRIVPRRYRPRLPRQGPAFVEAPRPDDGDLCGGCGPAAASRRGSPGDSPAWPAVRLRSALPADGEPETFEWNARPDLLDSGADDRHFVVEPDDEGGASLRFGDGIHGRAPEAGEGFTAYYRIGGGSAGNIGADMLRHIVFRNAFPEGIELRVGNPLPMRGGRDPETSASARLRAPFSFKKRLDRAVTAEDYAGIVMRDFSALVQRAAATLRSSGVRTEVQVAIDPIGQTEPEAELLACIGAHLERFRRMEHDVRVVRALNVPIDLHLEVCVSPGFIAEDVARRVRERLGPRPGGFFHPDALTFGGGISVSRLIGAVLGVEGVAHARVTTLNRLYEGPNGEIEAGMLPIGPTEIARLDQDPDAPENGSLTLVVKGGR